MPEVSNICFAALFSGIGYYDELACFGMQYF